MGHVSLSPPHHLRTHTHTQTQGGRPSAAAPLLPELRPGMRRDRQSVCLRLSLPPPTPLAANGNRLDADDGRLVRPSANDTCTSTCFSFLKEVQRIVPGSLSRKMFASRSLTAAAAAVCIPRQTHVSAWVWGLFCFFPPNGLKRVLLMYTWRRGEGLERGRGRIAPQH